MFRTSFFCCSIFGIETIWCGERPAIESYLINKIRGSVCVWCFSSIFSYNKQVKVWRHIFSKSNAWNEKWIIRWIWTIQRQFYCGIFVAIMGRLHASHTINIPINWHHRQRINQWTYGIRMIEFAAINSQATRMRWMVLHGHTMDNGWRPLQKIAQ